MQQGRPSGVENEQAANDPETQAKKITDLHRIFGLSLAPMLRLLGYVTEVEADISFQRQIIDVISVRRTEVIDPPLPKIYWQVFDELNEHNLISFKSYSESFNAQTLEEFYGHLTNYCKVRNVNRDKVNLYAVTNHYPRGLLAPLLKTKQVTTIREGEVFDLQISGLKRVRFIICRETDNPLLALFSDNVERISAAYYQLQNESELLKGVSVYWQEILTYIGEGVKNMYTKEDFLRDHPPREGPPPLLFSWQVEEMKLEMQRETILRILTHRFHADFDTDDQIKEQLAEEMAKVESESALDALLDVALTASDLSLFRQDVARRATADE